jgi:predicted nucleic acid-binding Zn ribbon protein
MPTYEYLCEINGRTVEVSHKMAEQLHTWGELCERAGISAGRTSPSAPVKKLISASAVLSGKGGDYAPAAACDTGPCDMGTACCGGGACSTH